MGTTTSAKKASSFNRNRSISRGFIPQRIYQRIIECQGKLNVVVLIAFFIRRFYDEIEDAFPQIKVAQLKSLPIPAISLSDPNDKARHDHMVKLVEQMLSLHKQLASTRTPDDKTRIQRKIDATDHQIDQLVYELYGLTDKEIQIVEQRTR
jgi:hypothetical protein